MVGDKIQQAKDALKYCIKSLSEEDRFNLITFSGEARPFKASLQEVTPPTREEALKFVEAIEARGGTNIDEALQMALGMQDTKSGRPFITVFMTDGLPTIGEQNPDAILKNVQVKNTNNTRIFTFGVGYDVNTHLLDKIAEFTKGAREYIAPQDNIEVKVSNFYDKIAYPVLANVMLNIDGIEVYDRYPRQLSDLFRGSQLVLFGRYKGEGNKLITLAGTVNDKPRKLEYEATFASTNETTDFIPVLWATSKIGFLLDEIRLHGENQEVKNEIVRLSKEFGIMTPYTAWLVVEDVRAQTRAGRHVQEGLARMAPEMARQPGAAIRMEAEEKALKEDSGKDAIVFSRRAQELQKGEIANDKARDREFNQVISQQMRQQADKTFYQDAKGIWYDASYDPKDEKKITQIKFMSEEYLDLVKKYPRLAKYLAVGEQIVVCWSDKIYQVVSE
jgi:Ca-activated chloride channel family protein